MDTIRTVAEAGVAKAPSNAAKYNHWSDARMFLAKCTLTLN